MCNSLGIFFPPQTTDKYAEIKLPLRSTCFSAPVREELCKSCVHSASASPLPSSPEPTTSNHGSTPSAPARPLRYQRSVTFTLRVNAQLPLLALCDLAAALDPWAPPAWCALLTWPPEPHTLPASHLLLCSLLRCLLCSGPPCVATQVVHCTISRGPCTRQCG